MSDKPISVGDLVIVLRGHCAHKRMGHIGSVSAVGESMLGDTCNRCGAKAPAVPYAEVQFQDGYHGKCPVVWLKRIDPDILRDETPTKQEITA